MADIHYYVSAQRGSDTNDGLSPATPFQSLTRALSVQATVGSGTLGSTVADTEALGVLADEVHVQRVVLAESRTVTKLTIDMDSNAIAVVGKAVIYSDVSGTPSTLVAASNELSSNVTGPREFTFASPVTLAPGTYWWGLHLGSGIVFVRGDSNSAATGEYTASDTYSDGTSSSFTISNINVDAFLAAINATYTIPRDTYINVGPGTYGKVVLQQGGIDDKTRIIWKADPDAAVVIGDKPGPVIISGRDAGGNLTPGYVWNGNNKNFVECVGFECDGSSDSYAFSGGTNGSPNRRFTKCRVTGGMNGFVYGLPDHCVASNLKGIGYNPTSNARHCVAINCATGWIGYACNCLAIGCNTGFTSLTNASVAVGCYTGFGSGAYALHRCLAVRCTNGYSTGWLYDCYEAGCSAPNDPALESSLHNKSTDLTSLSRWEANSLGSSTRSAVGVPSVAKGLGLWIPSRTSFNTTGFTVDLDVPILTVLNTNEVTPGSTTRGFGLIFNTIPAAGTVTVEFQENVNSVWTTRRSATKNVSQLLLNRMTVFEWPTPLEINESTSTWAVRISGAGGAEVTGATVLHGTPSYWHFTSRPDYLDLNDVPFPDTAATDLGPYVLSDVAPDWTTYRTATPGIKITGYGYQAFKVPVVAGQPITKKVWVKFADTGAQTVFTDEFDRADGPIGNGWTATDWSIVGGEAQAPWGFAPMYRSELVADGYWEADMYLPTPTDEYWENKFCIWIRQDPNGDRYDYRSHGYQLWLYGPGSLEFTAGRAGGVNETLWSYTLPSGPVTTCATSVRVGVQARGNAFDFYVNGAKVGSCEDTNPSPWTSGTYGFNGWEIENARVKSFRLQSAPGGPMSASAKPQIILRGLGVTEQAATAVGSGDWEELSLTATPTVDGVMELVILARDSAATAYSVFSDPS